VNDQDELAAKATQAQDAPPAQDAQPEIPAKKAKAKKQKLDSNLTLAQLAEGYLHWMEEAGKSAGTTSSYGMELKTAMGELGAETRVADLTAKQVQAFFDSKKVTRLKSGKEKAKPSIDKTRRVLRLALCWAEDRKLIEKAPIPETQAQA
jgi:hypothetical protein